MSAIDAFALAGELPGMVHVGRLELPVFGLLAALGVVTAMAVSQYTARPAQLDAAKLWDAGMFAIAAAFVTSRAILILAAPHTFIHFPLLVLTLPSLTLMGMTLSALATWGWLRWKKLPVADVLDAWAPCACVLAAVLTVAHFLEGTDAGMPTQLQWGVITPGDTVLGHVHPAELYACVTWLALGALALHKLRRRRWAGEAAAWTLALGGAASFLLDMVRQPVESEGSAWLDPSQYVALGACAAGVWWLLQPWMRAKRLQLGNSGDVVRLKEQSPAHAAGPVEEMR